ncbi:cyclase family protein [Rhodococcus zopfii]|uniref:Cyclase family protein n=1 Tax=Rhodococcus zopfii TaxID=43772 RepID=A0ABU3WVU1_9NOCA|nr:cyclase family protein [Rhodococcus zopfii]
MRVRRIVDLSRLVSADTQVYPGDPETTLTPHATLSDDGYNLLHIAMGSQTGTHVDAPRHMRAAGDPVDRLDPELFVGRGVVVDVRGLTARAPITADLLGGATCGPGDLVLLHTGWDAHYGTDEYFAHPYLAADACRELLGRGVRTIGIDAPSLDPTGATEFPAHWLIADVGGVICENLCGLERIDFPDPLISILPIRLCDGDGAPVRAVAMQVQS